MTFKDKLSAIVFGIPALFFLIVAVEGCDIQPVSVSNYTTTNTPPSRFKVASSDYYHMDGQTPNMTVTVLSDTQGTNDFLVISVERGVAMLPVPKPVKQLEDR